MKRRIAARTCAALTLLAVNACSILGGEAAVEPEFRVVLADGAIQVREYADYAVAETLVRGESYTAASNEGFRRLFDYITGDNLGSSKIEMTAPVLVTPETTSANAPVIVTPHGADGVGGTLDSVSESWMTGFILPEGSTAATAPIPKDTRIKLRDVPARRVAAIRFSGLLRNARAETRRRELAAWLDVRALPHEGDWRMAGYHPPWTLPPFRRNEVIVTLDREE